MFISVVFQKTIWAQSPIAIVSLTANDKFDGKYIETNKITINNRETKNSNCIYISNKFAKDKNIFRIRKEKILRKEKKSYNIKFP